MVILTQDIAYSRELASYLASCEDFEYKTIVFSDVSAFSRFAQENKVALLLCDREEIAQANGFGAENICLLSEYSSVRESDEIKNSVFKYQSTEQIKNEIMRKFAPSSRAMISAASVPLRKHRTGSSGISDSEDLYTAELDTVIPESSSELFPARTICVCSPLGGSRCSTYALALAEYYAKKGETLFLSLDPFFLALQEDTREQAGSLTELIYCLETSVTDGRQLLAEYVRRNRGVDCLPRVANWLDVNDITAEQAHRLVSCILSEEMYRNVIIDLGRPTAAFLECMALCSDIYVPRRKGKRDDMAISEWKRQLVASGFADIAGSLKERTLPFDKGLEGELSFDKLLAGSLGGYLKEVEDLGYFG